MKIQSEHDVCELNHPDTPRGKVVSTLHYITITTTWISQIFNASNYLTSLIGCPVLWITPILIVMFHTLSTIYIRIMQAWISPGLVDSGPLDLPVSSEHTLSVDLHEDITPISSTADSLPVTGLPNILTRVPSVDCPPQPLICSFWSRSTFDFRYTSYFTAGLILQT